MVTVSWWHVLGTDSPECIELGQEAQRRGSATRPQGGASHKEVLIDV